MEKIFLHVGYPKTGTTTLKLNIFRNHSQVFDIEQEAVKTKEVGEAIYGNSSFKPDSFRDTIEMSISKVSKKTGIYSDDKFTRNLRNWMPESIDQSTIARRLHEVFTLKGVSTEVILVVREQRSLLLSAFAFLYHKYRSMGYKNLNELVRAGIEGSDEVASNILSSLCYFDTINAYRESFGREKVHVFLYEELNRDEELFVRRISQVMGICADESIRLLGSSTSRNVTKTDGKRYSPSKMYKWLSILKSEYLPDIGSVRSSAFGRWVVDQLRKGGSEISLSESSISRLRDFYGEDNQRVETEFNIPLSEHGYLVS